MKTIYRTTSAATALALILCAAPARADEQPIGQASTAPTPEAAEADVQAGDIIVTAQRRAQNLRDVPVSIQAISADQLVAAGVGTTESLVAVTPSVTFNRHLSPFQSTIRIRGVGTNVSAPTVEPSVSMVVDGVVIARQASFFTDLIDIERVEVLRGPQSTLFGKNAVAGVISITTAKPNLTRFEGVAEATYNSFRDINLRGSVSGPLATNLGIRLTAGFSSEGRGVAENADPAGPPLDTERSFGVRGKLLWEPSEDVSFQLAADYRNASGPNTVRIPVRFESLAVQNLYGVGPVDTKNRRVAINGGPTGEHYYDNDDWGVSLEANIDLGGPTLTSVTAYRKYTLDTVMDIDQIPSRQTPSGYDDLVTIPGVGSVQTGRYPLIGNSATFGDLRTSQLSQELRLTSPGGGAFRWIIGTFAWQTRLAFDYRQVLAICPFNTAAPGFTAPPPRPVLGDGDPGALTGRCSFPPPNGVASAFGTLYDVDSSYYAGFGQFDYDIADALTLTGGLRLQRDNFSYVINGGRGATVGLPGYTSTVAAFTSARERNRTIVTGRASLTYKLDQYNNVYLSYARGYKGPGLDAPANLTAPPAGPLAPETVDAYELGYKGRLFDGALTLNAALFWQDFANLQQSAFNVDTATLAAINAGSSRQRGVELDLTWQPTRQLSITAGLVYLDAIYTDFRNSDCYVPRALDTGCRYTPVAGAPAIGIKDVTGERVTYSPEWSYNIAANYRVPVGDNAVVLNAVYRFTDEQQTAPSQNPDGLLPEYGIVDLRAGFEIGDGRFAITGYVNNVFDKSYAVFSTPFNYSGQVNAPNPNTVAWVIPKSAERSYGVTLRAKF